MKKQILFVLFILYSTCCFAISNITLHGVDNKILYDIKNNKIYNSDNELIGEIKGERFELIGSENNDNNKITEDKDFITIETDYVIFDYKRHDISTFSKKSGNILKTIDGNYTYTYYETTGKLERLYFYRDGKFSYCTGYVYDKSGNTIKEIDYDENDNIKTITEYIYDKKTNNVIKEIVYDENNQLDYYTTYTYDINTNNVIEECLYNNKNILEEKTEYNPITENEKFYYEYDENGKLLTKRIYDDISGYEIERQLYNGNSKDPEIKKFIQFDENGKYLLEDGYYLNSDFISYFELSFLKKEKLENWNDFYNAKFTEITYNQYYPGYKYLIQLLNKDLLFNRSFTLCNNNSTTYYCFDYTEDNRIDFSKCYEIQLIKKEVDYKAMNKSGEGKGPFGIDIGMTYEDVKKACNGKEPELIGDDRYFIEPVNSHPLFDKYIAWISKKYGVYYIKAYSDSITTSDYGTEVKNKFNNILHALEKKYGAFNMIDYVDSSYLYKEDKYWMKGLKDGARVYKANWYATKDNVNDFDGIIGIALGISNSNTYSTTQAYVWIEYEFRNFDEAEELLNDVL